MALPKENQSLAVSEATRRRYFQNLVKQLADLREAMEKSDFDSVREICHRMRGSASLFGLKDLGAAGREMEEAAIGRKLEEMVSGFQVIEVIVNRNAYPAEV